MTVDGNRKRYYLTSLDGDSMSSVILNQLVGIHSLLADGLITKEDARNGMIETVKYYFGKIGDYERFIKWILEV